MFISDLPTSTPALNNIIEPPAGVRGDCGVNTAIPPDEGMELTDEEHGGLEDLQRELQMIADFGEDIDLIIETVVDPDEDEIDAAKQLLKTK